jgi:hypothetical protein
LQEPFNLKLTDRVVSSDPTSLSRADFLKIAGLTAGGAVVAGVLAKGMPTSASASSRSPAQDTNILNFLLVLESLQAAFYQDAINKGALGGDLARFAQVVGDHERAHVRFLKDKLGSQADQPPSFDFGDTNSDPARFATAAVKLEELAVGAYVGQGANLTRKLVLKVARIASVEGRHCAWVRDIQKLHPAPDAADPGSDQNKVAAAMQALGFVKGGEQ